MGRRRGRRMDCGWFGSGYCRVLLEGDLGGVVGMRLFKLTAIRLQRQEKGKWTADLIDMPPCVPRLP